jgi:hypothetical protein
MNSLIVRYVLLTAAPSLPPTTLDHNTLNRFTQTTYGPRLCDKGPGSKTWNNS